MKHRLLTTYVIWSLLLLLLPLPTSAANASLRGSGGQTAFTDPVDDVLSLFATNQVSASFQFLASSSRGVDKAPLCSLLLASRCAQRHLSFCFLIRTRTLRAGLNDQCFCFGIPRAP